MILHEHANTLILLIFLICGEDFGLSDNSLTSHGIQTLSYRFAR